MVSRILAKCTIDSIPFKGSFASNVALIIASFDPKTRLRTRSKLFCNFPEEDTWRAWQCLFLLGSGFHLHQLNPNSSLRHGNTYTQYLTYPGCGDRTTYRPALAMRNLPGWERSVLCGEHEHNLSLGSCSGYRKKYGFQQCGDWWVLAAGGKNIEGCQWRH